MDKLHSQISALRQWFIVCLVASTLGLFPGACCLAQDNPFDVDGGDIFGEGRDDIADPPPAATRDEATSPDNDSLPSNANIVVRMLRDNPPKTLSEVGRAIVLTSRLKEWGEVARYLDQLSKMLGPGTSAALVKEFGTDVWIALSSEQSLSAEQRAVADKILQEVTQERRSPQTIAGALNDLNSQSALTRKRAAIRLQQAGIEGLRATIEEIAAGRIQASPIAIDLIHSYGEAGHNALAAAATKSDPSARGRILFASSAFASHGLMPQIAGGIYDSQVSDQTKEALQNVFTSGDRSLPTESQVRTYLQKQIAANLNNARIVRSDLLGDPLKTTFFLDPATSTLQYANVFEADYYLQKAAESGLVALRLSGIDETTVLATVAVLERDYAFQQVADVDSPLNLRTTQPFGSRTDIIGQRGQDVDFLMSVYRTAATNGLPAAQLRAVQQLGSLAPTSLLTNTTIELLMNASEASVPAVRMAALELLIKLQPDAQNRSVDTRIRRAQALSTGLAGNPTVLIVGGASDLRELAATQLRDLGMDSVEASSGREAIRIIQTNKSFEIVLIVDRLYDMTIAQLAQRIDSFPPTSAIPLGILTNDMTAGEQLLLRDIPQVTYGTLTHAQGYMPELLKRMNRAARLPLPSQSDRLVWNGLVNEAMQP